MIRAVDLDQLAKALPAQARLVECSALLARQPQTRILHPLAQGLARHCQPVTLRQLLGRQGRAEVGIAVPNERHGSLPDRRVDPVVRCPSTCLVPDRRRAVSPEPLQQPVNLSAAQVQNIGRTHG